MTIALTIVGTLADLAQYAADGHPAAPETKSAASLARSLVAAAEAKNRRLLSSRMAAAVVLLNTPHRHT